MVCVFCVCVVFVRVLCSFSVIVRMGVDLLRAAARFVCVCVFCACLCVLISTQVCVLCL